MSVNVTVEIKNLEQIRSAFRKAPEIMASELDRAIQKSIFAIQRDSMKNTPVDTGRLRASHRTKFSSLKGELDVGASYAIYVHEGTHRMKSRPFLANSVKDNESTVDDYFVNAVDNTLKKISDSSK